MRLATRPSGRRHSSQSRRTLVILLALVPALALGGCQQLARGEQTGIRSGSSFKPVQPARPTLDPDHAAAAAALTAFDALIKHPDLTYHVEELDTGQITLSGKTTTVVVKSIGDVAGADFAVALTIKGVVTQLRAVHGVFWAKASGKSWQHGSAAAMPYPSELLSPWRYLGDFGKLQFVSRSAGAEDAFVFTNTAPIGLQGILTSTLGIVGMITTLHFSVLGDGTPVSIDFVGEAPDGSGDKVTYSTTVTLTKVGGAIVVKSPA